jgi:teichuronic acid biosynthesis glycosyltransferase TuaC
VRVCVVAEYYPRRRDAVQGAWAHRQAVAARDAGADVRVLALERPQPSAAATRALLRGRPAEVASELRAAAAQPRRDTIDGIEVEYVRFVSPPRQRAYAGWHRWARRPLGRALTRLHSQAPLDLVHAHYALPAGGAALPWAERARLPLVVSVHGGDILSPLVPPAAARPVLRAAALVIANSRGILERAAQLTGSADRIRVIHPPGEPPPEPLPAKRDEPTVVTVGAVDPRKRHLDVLDALSELPDARWVVIGDGPERPALEARTRELGVHERVDWLGQLPPRQAIAELARCHVMAMPSVDEAFGVAYAEALACGVPAIGCRAEPGPEEIAALTPDMRLVPPRDPQALAEAITAALGHSAEAPEELSLETCGRRTLEAYEEALSG